MLNADWIQLNGIMCKKGINNILKLASKIEWMMVEKEKIYRYMKNIKTWLKTRHAMQEQLDGGKIYHHQSM